MCEWPVAVGVILRAFVILTTPYVFAVTRAITAATLSMAGIGAFLVIFFVAGDVVIGGAEIKYKRAAEMSRHQLETLARATVARRIEEMSLRADLLERLRIQGGPGQTGTGEESATDVYSTVLG